MVTSQAIRRTTGWLLGIFPLMLVAFSEAAETPSVATSPKDATALPGQRPPLQSGPQKGDVLRPFLVRKCAGNLQDGVPVGKKLCYRCRLGNRPVVLIFARNTKGRLAELLQQVDQLVDTHGEDKLASFVSLWGTEQQRLRSVGEQLVEQAKLQHMAIVVPEDSVKGPRAYRLNAELDFTVLVYREGRVMANFALKAADLDRKTIDAITQAARRLVRRS